MFETLQKTLLRKSRGGSKISINATIKNPNQGGSLILEKKTLMEKPRETALEKIFLNMPCVGTADPRKRILRKRLLGFWFLFKIQMFQKNIFQKLTFHWRLFLFHNNWWP